MFRKSVSDRSVCSFSSVLVTHVGLFLVSSLLAGCAGKVSADVTPLKITAFVGEAVILPCAIPLVDDDVPTVEWSKEGLSPNIVLLYRDGCETFDAKNPAFQYRTSLIMTELQSGNFSLRISNLQLSDKGIYWCKVLQGKGLEVIASLDLVVVSEPKLTVAPNDAGKLTLRCEVECWVPEPEIAFFDDQGKEITAEKPERAQHSGQCFSITRRATLQASTSRVTCRVHQLQSNLTRIAEIYNLGNFTGFSATSIVITVVVTLIAAVLLCGLVFLLWKKTGCSVRGEKSAVSGQTPDQDTTCRNQTDGVGNAELPKEPDEPKSTPENKGDETQQSTERLNAHGPEQDLLSQHDSRSSPVATQLDDLSYQNNSKPALVSTSNQNHLLKSRDPKRAVSSQNLDPGETNNAGSSNRAKRLSSVSFKHLSIAGPPEESEPLIE